MEEDDLNEDQQPEEEQPEITPQKLARLKNLKAFRGWTDEQIVDYIKKNPKPKPPPKLFSDSEDEESPAFNYDETEYKKKYDAYMKKYVKEYGVDMNETNDVQALQAFVRLTIQAEVINENIIKLQSSKNVLNTKSLKDMGDFQRSVQMSLKELQEQLGISRKTRKEKTVDDIPQYIKQLQQKAREKWNRATEPIICTKCNIELARGWYNFPNRVLSVNMTIVCDKCEETVVYSR